MGKKIQSKAERSALSVGSIVIDCNDLQTMSAFWREALLYVPRGPAKGDFIILQDPKGLGVNVSLALVPEPRIGKNRLHLDLYTENQGDEVQRLLELGATRFPRTPKEGEDFIVLQDPEGNLFCVIDTATHLTDSS